MASKSLQYKGGLPLRKHVQVATRGDKVITVTRRQLDLQQALANYQKTRDNVAVKPNASVRKDIKRMIKEGQQKSPPPASRAAVTISVQDDDEDEAMSIDGVTVCPSTRMIALRK